MALDLYHLMATAIQQAEDAFSAGEVPVGLEQTSSQKGTKAVIGNKGYARFLKNAKGSVQIDPEAVERDRRFDGKFVLNTSTKIPSDEAAKTYKSLWRVERTFREEKSTLEIRPIFHHRDDTSIGHIVAGFLALRLEVDLQRRLEENNSRSLGRI
ncbi:MAG: hypothetical protein JRI76_05705 [Deltaproteobacteria bacterium]|nr:hypothetical protein [Deltaproteobacteria bacterium]MBW1954386.1 hypothetical protein [Deltaproteobacteria bacterium]MBW2041514.1 hypothetical protein [Deltaproteobacteria bacterium]MBW2131596.1 hypothetical protein [Deltaproteobacteria bacterium]